jgi:hypothetical protein
MAAFEYWYSLLVLCTPGEDAPRTKEGEKDGQEQHPVHHAQGYDQQDHLPARPGKFKVHLKGQCHTILTSGLFHKQVSPKPLSIPFADIFTAQGTLPVFSWISFSKAHEYTVRAIWNFLENSRVAAQGAPLVSLTTVANGKNLPTRKS